jgi:hypothetical protein
MCGQKTAQLRVQEPEGPVRGRGMGCASVVAVCAISISQLPEGLANLLMLVKTVSERPDKNVDNQQKGHERCLGGGTRGVVDDAHRHATS